MLLVCNTVLELLTIIRQNAADDWGVPAVASLLQFSKLLVHVEHVAGRGLGRPTTSILSLS